MNQLNEIIEALRNSKDLKNKFQKFYEQNNIRFMSDMDVQKQFYKEFFPLIKEKKILSEDDLIGVTGGAGGFKKVLSLLMIGTIIPSLSNSIFALDVYNDASGIAQSHKSELDKLLYLRFAFTKKHLEDKLLKISHGTITPKNAEVEKLAKLYEQHTQLDEETVLKEIKDRYHNEIDKVNTPEDAMKMLQKLHIDLSVTPLDPNVTAFHFRNELLKDLSLTTDSPDDIVNSKLEEFKKVTAELNLKTDKDSIEEFKLILCACNDNLPVLKDNMKNCVNAFCDEYSAFFGYKGYDNSVGGIAQNGFSSAVNIAFLRAYDALDDIINKDVMEFLKDCSNEVKSSFKQLIMNSERFSEESKEAICNALDKVPVNSVEYQFLQELDGLKQLELKDNFIDSLISLKRIQKNLQSEYDCNNISPYTIKSALKPGCESIYFPDSMSSDCSNTEFGVYMVLNDLYAWNSISKIEGLAESMDMSHDELFKWMVKSTMAHEFGHILDKICGTERKNLDSVTSSPFCKESEQKSIIELKELLKTRVAAKCENRTNWIPESLSSQGEIFADFMLYNIIYNDAKNKGLSPQKIGTIVSKAFPIASLDNIAAFQGRDSLGMHPSNKIRFDSTVGLNEWFYDLGLDIDPTDTVFTNPEDRIKF